MTTEIPEALAVLDRTINYIQNRCELCPSDNEMRKARAAFADLIKAATEISESTESWNRAVTKIIGRQPNTGLGTEEIRSALTAVEKLK